MLLKHARHQEASSPTGQLGVPHCRDDSYHGPTSDDRSQGRWKLFAVGLPVMPSPLLRSVIHRVAFPRWSLRGFVYPGSSQQPIAARPSSCFVSRPTCKPIANLSYTEPTQEQPVASFQKLCKEQSPVSTDVACATCDVYRAA
jgi:hypothetical protein